MRSDLNESLNRSTIKVVNRERSILDKSYVGMDEVKEFNAENLLR